MATREKTTDLREDTNQPGSSDPEQVRFSLRRYDIADTVSLQE